MQGKYGEAEGELRRAAELAEQAGLSPLTRCTAFRSLGVVLRAQGKYGEAQRELWRAAELAERENLHPLARCNVTWSLGHLLAGNRDRDRAVGLFARSQQWLLSTLSQNRWPEGMKNLLSTYGDVFRQGRRGSRALWQAGQDPRQLWQLLDFAEGQRCVVIREGLRRLAARRRDPHPTRAAWRWGPRDWPRLFGPPAGSAAIGTKSRWAVRGLRSSGAPAAPGALALEPADEAGDPARQQFCQLAGRAAIRQLLPDADTALVVFCFDGDDLTVLPIFLGPDTGELKIEYLHVEGVGRSLARLLKNQERTLEACLQPGDDGAPRAGRPARELDQDPGTLKEGVYQDLYELLRLDQVLARIEPDRSRWSRLHLVLVPDRPLFLFSLPAAHCKTTGRRLYQQVASVRCALSLRTLELQQQIQDRRAPLEANDYQLRGVLFANPDQGEDWLPSVVTEVANVVEATGIEHWWVHGEREPERAVRPALRSRHPSGNVLMGSGHGGPVRDPELPGPGLRLCDGELSDARMVAEGYTFEEVWLLYWSCCLLGQLNAEARTKEVEGFMATLIMLGCRRVLSALWPISDRAAAEFSRHWVRALQEYVFNPERPRGPHAFALAFKAALESFRQADGGYYYAGK
jgi:hypothetical protein